MTLASNMDSPESISILKQGRIYVSCFFFYPVALPPPPPPNKHAVHKCQEQGSFLRHPEDRVENLRGTASLLKGLS